MRNLILFFSIHFREAVKIQALADGLKFAGTEGVAERLDKS